MKLLLFSDVHCDGRAGKKLVEMSRSADLVIGAGDFANMRHGLQPLIDVLSAIATPTVVVPGNGESDSELRAACARWPAAHVLHGSGTQLLGIDIWGMGGAVPLTPFGSWSFDLTEEAAETMLAPATRGGILVSHSPPKGLLDSDSKGNHLGSKSVLAAVERFLPQLVVCGHIHASAGRSVEHGPTTVINAGPQGMWFDFQPAA
jgi:Icc-related predicted phosphoesterase